jgi:hypothetical protein
MRDQFIEKNFSTASHTMLIRMNDILSDYVAQGYRLSVRQLYYQLVARAVIQNSQRSYKCIVDLVSNARLAGLIEWNVKKKCATSWRNLQIHITTENIIGEPCVSSS